MEKLAIIAGSGNLPLEIIAVCRKKGKDFCLVIINDEVISSPQYEFYRQHPHLVLAVGQVGKAIKYLREQKVEEIIFAGKVARPSFANLAVDLTGAKLLKRLLCRSLKGDDELLQVVANFFAEYKFKIIGLADILPEGLDHNGLLTNKKISAQVLPQFPQAIKMVLKIGDLDIGQAIIFQDGVVIAVEAAEGTNEMIKRSAPYLNQDSGAFMAKAAKPRQDERMDLPTIGVETVILAAECGLVGLLIQSGKVMIANQQKTIDKANELGIFIYSI